MAGLGSQKIQNSAKPPPVTTEERAIEIACAYLEKPKENYANYFAKRTVFEGRDIWFVCFDIKTPPGVLKQLPGSVYVFVDPFTGEAEGVTSL